MKEIGVLMKPDLAQAAHDDLKTQTRRLIENQNLQGAPRTFKPYVIEDGRFGFENEDDSWICPYGKPGDLIYVKELHYAYGVWWRNGYSDTGREKWKFEDLSDEKTPVLFPNNPPETVIDLKFKGLETGYYKRNSLFMPKKHVRTWARIKDIRVERLQDISEDDALKEGIIPSEIGITNRTCFRVLWDSINAARGYGWDKNPWVWVIEFEKIEDWGEEEFSPKTVTEYTKQS